MIVAHALSLHIGGLLLVDRASFIAETGELVAVLGRNGSGKTTLLRTLAGVRAFQSGTVHVGGRDLRTMTPPERARIIAHLSAEEGFSDTLSVGEVVAMGRYAHHRWWEWRRSARDDDAVGSALDAVGMASFAARPFDTLSSGERQRVWIALALAQEAPVLLLDEPTSHLDMRSAQEILRLLRRLCDRGKTIVCALHDVNEASQIADKLLLLGSQRMLAFDSAERILKGPFLEQAYGVKLETVRTGETLRVFPSP